MNQTHRFSAVDAYLALSIIPHVQHRLLHYPPFYNGSHVTRFRVHNFCGMKIVNPKAYRMGTNIEGGDSTRVYVKHGGCPKRLVRLRKRDSKPRLGDIIDVRFIMSI